MLALAVAGGSLMLAQAPEQLQPSHGASCTHRACVEPGQCAGASGSAQPTRANMRDQKKCTKNLIPIKILITSLPDYEMS